MIGHWVSISIPVRAADAAADELISKDDFKTDTTIWQEQKMTGYTVHSGTTIKFSEGWDRVFKEGTSKTKTPDKKATSRGAAKAKTRVKRAAKKKR